MESPLFLGLNEAQREAVVHKDGPMLILAGPGSGKTRVVTHRIAYLIEQDVPSWNIAALTFTNKAADEMKERLTVLSPENHVWIGTFHRFCAWILRQNIERIGLQPNFTIYDTDESKHLLDRLIDKKNLPPGCDASQLLNAISWAKNHLVLPENYAAREGHLLGQEVKKIYPRYQEVLRSANAVDFDDLLLYTAQLLRNDEELRCQLDNRFRYILVDEYQDTNLVQYAIARALSQDYPNLAVTGDPDQSIYGWRGANIQNILDFEKDFQNVHVVRLEENYRSCGSILDAASALIKHNKLRKEKELFTQKEYGQKPRLLRCFDQQEEAESIAAEIAEEIDSGKRKPGDYAVFFRMNALSRNLEQAFRQRGIPFILVRGLEFFNRKEIKDILAYLQLIYNTSDTIAFQRVINLPGRGIGKVTVNKIADYAFQYGLSLFAAAEKITQIPGISPRTQKAVAGFTAMIRKLSAAALDSDMEVLLTLLFEETQYLADFNSGSEEDKQRLANVQELLSEVREFDAAFDEEEAVAADSDIPFWDDSSSLSDRLGRYLEQVSLSSDADAYDKSDRVSLMTLHAAKGLEFPVVYIVAVEENILPHERSSDNRGQLEEERRLFFVGMTRAQEILRMSSTDIREYRGRRLPTILSSFLYEIPSDLLDVCHSHSADGSWGRTFSAVRKSSPVSDSSRKDVTDIHRSFSSKGELGTKKTNRQNSPQILEKTEDGLIFETNEYCEPADRDREASLFDEEGNLIAPPRVSKRPQSLNRSVSLHVGSDMEEGKSQRSKMNWEISSSCPEPKAGMLLRHPAYGVGFIKNIYGPPNARVVNVDFISGAGLIEIALSDPDIKILSGGKPRTNQ